MTIQCGRAVATGNTIVSMRRQESETGAGSLVVVANGIPSKAVSLTVK
jgi:hypothetical protein